MNSLVGVLPSGSVRFVNNSHLNVTPSMSMSCKAVSGAPRFMKCPLPVLCVSPLNWCIGFFITNSKSL